MIKGRSNLCLIAGLLAVGGTDGLVKVFSLQVFPSISVVAQYVLWGDKDDLQVQWLNWLRSHQVCETHVLLLTLSQVCITVKNSPNPLSVYIRLCNHRKKVFLALRAR